MRHDYDLPPDWAGMTSDEKNQWLTQERCRRQAMQQATALEEHKEKRRERLERRLEANGYEPLDRNR